MNVREHSRRVLSVALLLAMLVGLIPGGLGFRAEAAGITRAQVESALTNLPALQPVNQMHDVPRSKDGESVAATNEAFKALSGDFYVVTSDPVGGEYYMLHPFLAGGDKDYPDTFPAAKVSVVGNSVVGADPSLAVSFEWSGIESGSGSAFPTDSSAARSATTPFYVSFKDGRQLKLYQNAIRRNDSKNTTVNVFLHYRDGKFGFRYNNGSFGDYAVTLDTTSHSTYDYFVMGSSTDPATFRLYRILDNRVNTEPLYNAIMEMKSYISKESQFEESTYEAFLSCMYEAVQSYRLYNGADQPADTDVEQLSKELKLLSEELLSYAMELEDYIDIALEAYDFRADGFMFEALYTFGAPYSLSGTSPNVLAADGVTSLSRPGKFTEGENYNWNKYPNGGDPNDYQYSINGLIENELVDGRIVYTEAVVEYIAMAIWAKEDFAKDSSYYPDWNGVFLDFANKLDRTNTANIGSYADTLSKTDTKAKGGTLLWKNVKTAYDLAYYMLHGVWFKAEEREENVLETKVTRTGETVPMYYNTYIDEFTSLRLLPTGKGSYKFTSGSGYAYNSAEGYIYNDYNSARSSAPRFNIAANLGYESDDMFGIAQTGYRRKESGSDDVDTDAFYANANYYYVFHASSPFIYRREDNLEFYFVGDDDVYFFINDQLVCDLGGVHGSPSATRKLNELVDAGKLDLKDGDICTFDMFFADRHLSSINLTLETNIKMMDATVETEKNQYDAATGRELDDGTAVTTGADIAYGFAMTNRMELGITDLSFDDPNLRVSLSKDGINLNGTCQPSELVLTYTTCDDNTGELCADIPTEWEYSKFKDLLYESTFEPETTVNPLPVGAYRVKLTSGQELTQMKELLDIGLPANTRIDIYGMRRQATGGKFTNTLTTACYPLDLNDQPGTLIEGTASCTLYAMDLGEVQVKEKASIVLDYGKPVDVNPSLLTQYIDYDPDSIDLKFVGLRLNDSYNNGASYPTCPTDLSCTPQRPQVLGKEGTFSRRLQYIRYTLNGFMEEVETCDLLYSVEYRNDPGNIRWYVALELDLIPANMMYYEAENLAPDLIRYEEITGNGTQNPEWLVKTDTTLEKPGTALSGWSNPSTEAQDTVILGEGQKQHTSEEFILFSFDEGADYSSPVYKGLDYSLKENWAHNSNRNTNVGVDDGAYHGEFQLNTDVYSDYACWFQTTSKYNNLSYHPTENDCFKIRIRLDNVRCTSSSGNWVIGLRYYVDGSSTSVASEYRPYSMADFNNQGYITIEYDFENKAYKNLAAQGKVITAVRLEINHVDDLNTSATGGGSFAVDYMYIGPKEYSYLLEPECVFMDFTDSPAEQMHYYMNKGYAGMDWNEVGNWSYNTTNTKKPIINTQEGLLSIEQTEAGYNGKNGYWVQSSIQAQQNFPMTYDPSNAEVVQIRFKLKNIVPKYSMEEVDALSTPATRNEKIPKIYLQYYYTANKWGDGATNDNSEKIQNIGFQSFFYDSATMDDQYMTVTMHVASAFKTREKITALRVSLTNMHSKSATELGTLTVDYIYIGDVEHLPGPVTYGYDSSYDNDTALSDGSSLFAQGKGVKIEENTTDYTEISFNFRGTGFDLISRTGKAQGTIRVELQNKTTGDVIKRLTVNNKGELELYQIPVVSMQGLPYGNYNVKLWVNAAVESDYAFLERGNEFYFDALRIYDPIEPGTNNTVQNAYETDLEAHTHIKEVRNILLSADAFGTLQGSATGAVFVDMVSKDSVPTATDADGNTVESDLEINNRYALSVETYNKVGPKNEVYLDPGQAIAFRLELAPGVTPVGLDIGAKTITGQEACLAAAILQSYDNTTGLLTISGRQVRTIGSATSMYYPLETEGNQMFIENGVRYCYVVIYNCPTDTAVQGSRSHVLSITDIKATYALDVNNVPEDNIGDTEIKKRTGETLEEPVRFMVDGNTTRAVATVIRSLMELPAVETELTLRHSLNLSSDIALNYMVPKSALEDYDSFYLTCDVPRFEGEYCMGYDTVTVTPVERDGYYYFTLEGLTAVNMMDKVIARLHMEKSGESFQSREDEYSIAQYAYAQLNREGASLYLRTLCANLLRYGAMAQSYKGYRTDCLADHAMTQAQRALLTDLGTVSFENVNEIRSELSTPVVRWAGEGLVLDSKVTLRYIVDVADSTVTAEELTLRVRYTDYSGMEKEVVLTGAQPYGNKGNWYAFDFDGLLAAELRTILYATVYVGETQVSDTLVYSVDTYGANKTGELGDLCKALFAYSDSAKTYFVS